MTLTEEQRGTVEPTGGFDLEAARAALVGALKPGGYHDQETARIIHTHMPSLLAEIERLREALRESEQVVDHKSKTSEHWFREYCNLKGETWIGPTPSFEEVLHKARDEIERLQASLIDLHAEYINTLEKNPECSAWDLDEQSIEDQRRLRRNAAHAISIVEPPIYLQADQQAARIKELEGMLSIRTEELDIAHSVARSEKEMHEKELAAFARRIKELEDAHKRSGAKYAKIINELRSSVYANIPGLDVGKIGPDAAKPQSWQITEERKAALWHAIKVLKENDIMEEPEEHLWDEEVTVLQAMLREAGQ